MISDINISAQENKIPVGKMRKDVKFFFSTVKKTHPNPYALVSAKMLDSVEKRIISKLNKPLSLFYFSRIMELEINSLFDAHTHIRGVMHYFKEINYGSSLFFPWDICIEKNDVFLIDDLKKQKIVTINQHSIEDILRDLQYIFSADMSEDTKCEQIEIFFAYYYYYLYLEDSVFTVSILDSNNHVIELSKHGNPQKEIDRRINTKYMMTSDDEDFRLDFYSDSIAYLKVNTFDSQEEDSSLYIDFLKRSFKLITEKQSKYLFIDIKNNSGGSSYNVFCLLDYLFKDDYKVFGWVSQKRRSKAYIKEYEKGYGISGALTKDKKYEINYGYFERQQNETNYPFTGTLFLLQSNKTRSASLCLSSTIKASRRGIIIGMPTGEPASEYSQGLVFEMPNSKLIFQCATGFFTFPSGSTDDKWIQPDIYVDFKQIKIDTQILTRLIDIARKEYPSFFSDFKPAKITD
jgi:hypothetical protein